MENWKKFKKNQNIEENREKNRISGLCSEKKRVNFKFQFQK